MIEIVALTSSTGPLTKRISLDDDGRLVSDGSAYVMGRGTARRVRFQGVADFAQHISRLPNNQAIALGSLRSNLPDDVDVITHRDLSRLNGTASPNLIARTASHIAYQPERPALALIDYDTKGMPAAISDRIKALGGFWPALLSVVPELAAVARVGRTSTSAGLFRRDTGERLKGSNGVHVYLLVRDGADIERFLRTLHDRCWLAGLGWMMVGAGGQLLERSLIDRSVYAAERLVFEAAPIVADPLAQDATQRAPKVIEGEAAETRALCPDLSLGEQARLRDLNAAERHRLAPAAREARAAFVATQAARIIERTGCSPAAAERTVKCQCNGTLLPGLVLPFDAEEFAGCTVADVLADPSRFVGATLADPLEGISYGACKAKIMRRPEDGTLWVHSFAHGRTTYELKYDAATIEAAIKKAEPTEAAAIFVRMLLAAELDAEEEQHLREFVAKIAGIKARPLAAKIKAAQAEQRTSRAKAEQERRAAERTDKRLQVPVPPADAERLPVIEMLDDVLCNAHQPEPPMRDLDGHPVEVRTRPPLMLHELTSEGANQNEPEKTRLPPPEMPLLTRHDRYSLAHEIERHIEFTVEAEDSFRRVALPATFVDHFMAFRDSKLPRVGAIVTAPLVLPSGELLAPVGLDRERKLVFRIEPRLSAMMPKPTECTTAAAREALRFLTNEWLCDVSTDYAGKCVLIALALTILERVLLPERPAFFVTAGKRGGGKTTALMMVILAVTGKKPPAAAWSSSEEERRKAILAYLAEGLPALVWDNIPLGTTISCPTIEKVLTAESYSDRFLGETATLTVPSVTVMAFTGNNIGPRGDMASRSLMTRIEVDRPDPENRTFKHADPVAWTLGNRGKILRALYTILLGNSQLKPGTAAPLKTRFKPWWHLVGSSVENAATAGTIDFTKLFADIEAEDEEAIGLADVLEVLDKAWPTCSFLASEVARRINSPTDKEKDDAKKLREFFDPNGRKAGGEVSTVVIGKRLAAIVGTPVPVGDRTMKLTRYAPPGQETQKRSLSFKIKIGGA